MSLQNSFRRHCRTYQCNSEASSISWTTERHFQSLGHKPVWLVCLHVCSIKRENENHNPIGKHHREIVLTQRWNYASVNYVCWNYTTVNNVKHRFSLIEDWSSNMLIDSWLGYSTQDVEKIRIISHFKLNRVPTLQKMKSYCQRWKQNRENLKTSTNGLNWHKFRKFQSHLPCLFFGPAFLQKCKNSQTQILLAGTSWRVIANFSCNPQARLVLCILHHAIDNRCHRQPYLMYNQELRDLFPTIHDWFEPLSTSMRGWTVHNP